MVSKLDDSVGRIVKELEDKNMLNDSIIIFSTDNGGPAEGFNLNAASNWPLRGVKNTLWEGGVRGAGLIWSPRIRKRTRLAEQTMHIVEWLPTLLSAINGSGILSSNITNFDGVDVWSALSEDKLSPRKTVLHNIDDIWGSAAITVDDWKLMVGTNYGGSWDGWYGPAGEMDPKAYDTKSVYNCLAGRALSKLNLLPTEAQMLRLRHSSLVNCGNVTQTVNCRPWLEYCLFNIREDPCEKRNLVWKYPKKVEELFSLLQDFNKTAVPPGNLPLDPRGDPILWDYVWTNFGDYSNLIFNKELK